MTIKVRLAKASACLASVAALSLASNAYAQAAPSAAKSSASLTVVYEFTGTGVEKPKSNERHVTWTVTDRYDLKASLTAQKPSGFPSMHKMDAAAEAREADRAKAAQQAQKDMTPMMDQAAKIVAQCGEDEACITRETMKMAQGINVNSPQMQSAKTNIGKASVVPADRYQIFQPGTASGTFAIDEKAYEAYFDAACSLKTEATCAINTTVKGAGKLADANGKTTMPSSVMGELDLQEGSLILTFPFLGIAKATKTTDSKSPDRKSGTEEVIRAVSVPNTEKLQLTAKCGACKTAEGTYTTELNDQLLGRKGTLKVTWKFTRP
ncbi:MAG: hypothetical protein QM773_04465 [Hyphomonadaceae bacterium]